MVYSFGINLKKMNNTQKYTTSSPGETEEFAWKFAKEIKNGTVVCLWGELGAGKTTFARGFVKGLGFEDRVMSPTFTLVRTYSKGGKVGVKCYHIDLYRLDRLNSLGEIGLDEIFFEKNSIALVEWPERLGKMLPSSRIDIKITPISDEGRSLVIEKYE